MTAGRVKVASEQGSGGTDSVHTQAATLPVPQATVQSKPPAGLQGPKGLAPRQTYSKVNTGTAPVMDIGAQQKLGFNMNTAVPTSHQIMQAALAGAAQRLSVGLHGDDRVKEASAKVASADLFDMTPDMLNSLADALDEMAKQAAEEGNKSTGVGAGPNHLQVTETRKGGEGLKPQDLGRSPQAPAVGNGSPLTHADETPKSPNTQVKSEPTQPQTKEAGAVGAGLGAAAGAAGGQQLGAMGAQELMAYLAGHAGNVLPANAMAQQPLLNVDTDMLGRVVGGLGGGAAGAGIGHGIESLLGGAGKAAPAAAAAVPEAVQAAQAGQAGLLKDPRVLAALGIGGAGAAGVGGAAAMGAFDGGQKTAAINALRDMQKSAALKGDIDFLRDLQVKLAGTPTNGPAGTSATGEAGAKPALAPGQEQKANTVRAVGNDGESFTKKDAKKPESVEAGKHLSETPLKDPVLERVFANSGKAGVKTASDMSAPYEALVKSAAAQEFLGRMAQKMKVA